MSTSYQATLFYDGENVKVDTYGHSQWMEIKISEEVKVTVHFNGRVSMIELADKLIEIAGK